jgi:hypothetical protein
MLHNKRRWCVTPVSSAEELARKLTESTWCGCTAFALGDYWFLNDSTCPDGAQEFGVVKIDGGNGKPIQVESITFGWCNETKALEYIRDTLNGRYDRSDFTHEVAPTIENPQQHGRCHHCA